MFSQNFSKFNTKKYNVFVFNLFLINQNQKWTNYDEKFNILKKNYYTSTLKKKVLFKNILLKNNNLNLNKKLFNTNNNLNEITNNFIFNIIKTLPKFIECVIYNKNETTIYIKHKYIVLFLMYLKNNVNNMFKVLIDLTAVDYPSRKARFELVYNLLSLTYNTRIRIKCNVDEIQPCLSVTTLYSSANWWERETYDMFGIFFSNHPDLRRILTDYGFIGYPLRKDFPLSGFVEVRYDDSEKRVVTEPVEMTQEFRYFDFNTPWNVYLKN